MATSTLFFKPQSHNDLNKFDEIVNNELGFDFELIGSSYQCEVTDQIDADNTELYIQPYLDKNEIGGYWESI